VLIGTYLGTHWEQKQQCVFPAPNPKENKIGPSYLYAELSHWFHDFFKFLRPFIIMFNQCVCVCVCVGGRGGGGVVEYGKGNNTLLHGCYPA
jgi:hypothetical protein